MINCQDCQDTGRLWNKPCHCQATDKATRACVKCNRRFELTGNNFKPVEATITNRGFSWHCKGCLIQIGA